MNTKRTEPTTATPSRPAYVRPIVRPVEAARWNALVKASKARARAAKTA